MRSFSKISDDVKEESFCNLLYVGPSSKEASRVLEAARAGGAFRRIVEVAPEGEDWTSLDEFISGEELYVGQYRGCLVVLWGLEAMKLSPRELERLAPKLERAHHWSPQAIALALHHESELSFLELTELLTREIVEVGDAETCRAALEHWCSPGEGQVGLKASFSKTPSGWLRLIKHDYLSGGVLAPSVQPLLLEKGLEGSQAMIDYWQNAVRNVLVHIRMNVRARALAATRLEDEPEIVRAIARTPWCLVVPSWLRADLEELDLALSKDFTVYGGPGEAAARVAELADDGKAAVLLWEGSLEPPRLGGAAGLATPVPTVLVGRDEPPRTDWTSWRRLFAHNVLGGFSRDELIAEGQRGRSILEIKPSFWRSFAFHPLPAAIEEIGDRMLETYLALREEVSEDRKKKLYRSIAEVEAARELFFGPTEARPTRGDLS